MVNLGRSKGCRTCKRRRIKCDETKPACKRCARLGVECEGYEQKKKTLKIKFIHHALTVTPHPQQLQRQKSSLAVLDLRHHHIIGFFGSLPPDEESLAFGFFLNSFIGPGRDFGSSRGFLANIMPALSTAHMDSPVYLAFSAVATQMYSQWRDGTLETTGLSKMRLVQALERLQAALKDPIESKTQATLMATLLLQFHDNVTSVQRLRINSRTHQNGALALAMHQGRAGLSNARSNHVLFRLINVEVYSAIREGRPVQTDLSNWCKSNEMPRTPSFDLDKIGINVADMQRNFAQTWDHHSRCTIHSCPHLSAFFEVCEQAKVADEDLNSWVSDLPKSSTPFKFNVERLQSVDPPIQTYLGFCDVYPSVQIASTWNTWRSYRLMVLVVMLACVEALEYAGGSESPSYIDQNDDKTSIRVEIRNIVDSICASVPFHVGNRTSRISLEDFRDTALQFPSYHCFIQDESGIPDLGRQTPLMPRDQHIRHVIAQGAWHIINPLSRIISLCLGPAGDLLESAMGEGQLPWIRGQLLRCVAILGLNQNKVETRDLLAKSVQKNGRKRRNGIGTQAEDYAEMITEVFKLTMGP